MINDEEWKIINSSEIFREYSKGEYNRMAKEAAQKKAEEANIEATAMDNLYEFEKKVRSDVKLSLAFRNVQKKIIADVNYRDSLDEGFVNGIMLLDLGEE